MPTGTSSNDHMIGTAGDDLLYGLGGDDLIEGRGGNDTLDGGAGADRLVGGAGNDLYYLETIGDKVIEAADEGTDRIDSLVSYSLAGQYVEILRLLGSADLKATGNNLANTLTGNDGANLLNGAGGADTMAGGLGNDRYIVDNAGDTVTEASAAGGTDRVDSAVSFTLGANVENLILTGNATITATGNGLANIIVGNSAGNLIDGGAGADEMEGKGGNDRYIVDNAGDKVFEMADGGLDIVDASVSYSLAGQYVETLRLTGAAAINATGNGQANTLQGNDAANTLSGGGGDDKLVGNGGNDLLDGGTGADRMFGGAGDDTYVVNAADDVVTEEAGEGADLVKASVAFTLGAHVEKLTLTGSSAIAGTGNSLSNVIAGNGAANVLNGGAGADTLTGGAGNDSFAFTAALGASNIDTITDFTRLEDKIVLGGAAGQAFAALATGALGEGAFAYSNGVGAAARIVYNIGSGILSYDADGNGAGAAVQFAKVTPGIELSRADFVVSGAPNNAPVVTSPATASVAENVPTSQIVYQVAASDADGDSLVYSLSGADAYAFTIDQTGAVRFDASPDYEKRTSYSFSVSARDSSGATGTQAVTLAITDVADSITYRYTEKTTDNNTTAKSQLLESHRFTTFDDPNLYNDAYASVNISGSIAAGGDKDFYRVFVAKDHALIIDVEATTTLDALVRVYNSNGVLIAENDDMVSFDPGSTPHEGVGHNMDSFLRVRVPESGDYYFSIEAFPQEGQTPSSGAYEINVSLGPVATKAELDQENVDAINSGALWDDLSLTYSFTTSATQYGADEGVTEKATLQTLNTTQRTAVNNILDQVENLTGLSFTQLTTNMGTAQMRYALTTAEDVETAHAYYPGTGDGGDSWYNATGYVTPKVGNYAYKTFVHETGHALGLKHGHEAPALSSDRDSMEYSIMTYRSYVGASDETGYTNETWGYAQTFMMYDIAALQQMYGADYTYNATNSVYTWNAATGAFMINGTVQWTPGANRVFMTLWDGGGTDTYDLSNYSGGVIIDLRPGEWTTTSAVQLAGLGDLRKARGNVANALQQDGDERSLIENAIGGTGADTLIANAAANRLTGGGGADTFRWASHLDSAPGEADTVTDFLRGADKIDLSMIDAGASTDLANEGFTWIGSGAFSGTEGELRATYAGGNATVYGDVNGDAVADFQLVLTGLTTLGATDFML